MVKKFGDYDKTVTYGSFTTLPRGAYKLVVKGAKVETFKNGDCIKLAVDIVDGEYAGYFAKDFAAQKSDNKKWRGVFLINIPKDDGTEKDNKTKRWFKTTIDAFEKSNYGYRWNWDELTLKGKSIAGLFVVREYENASGEIRKMTALRRLVSIDDYENGTYIMPDDELLTKNDVYTNFGSTAAPSEFVPVQPEEAGDLPF